MLQPKGRKNDMFCFIKIITIIYNKGCFLNLKKTHPLNSYSVKVKCFHESNWTWSRILNAKLLSLGGKSYEIFKLEINQAVKVSSWIKTYKFAFES